MDADKVAENRDVEPRALVIEFPGVRKKLNKTSKKLFIGCIVLLVATFFFRTNLEFRRFGGVYLQIVKYYYAYDNYRILYYDI